VKNHEEPVAKRNRLARGAESNPRRRSQAPLSPRKLRPSSSILPISAPQRLDLPELGVEIPTVIELAAEFTGVAQTRKLSLEFRLVCGNGG
jgi:hypothetical protein